MTAVLSSFDVKGDPRKRFTIAAATFDHYHVKVFEDGHMEFFPQVLTDPTVALSTLERMDDVMHNFARGRVGGPMAPEAMLAHINTKRASAKQTTKK